LASKKQGLTNDYRAYILQKIIWLVVFNHLEKYESQWEGLSHTLWKIKNVPNHQADYGSITRKVG